MFHLLVSYAGWPDHSGTIGSSRIYISPDNERDASFLKNGRLDIAKVQRIPALLMTEIDGQGSPIAKVVQITSLVQGPRDTVIQYMIDTSVPTITNTAFQALATQAGLTNLALSHTHWQIVDCDLFKLLLQNQHRSSMAPKVFSLGPTGEVEDDLISVMMPFGAEFKPVYEALTSATEELSLRCVRADDFWEHPQIMQDIVTLIVRARIVICDCSGKNPNVFYETGIAHTLGKEVIIITQSANDLPFDLRHLRYIAYLNNKEGRKELTAQVLARVRKILGL